MHVATVASTTRHEISILRMTYSGTRANIDDMTTPVDSPAAEDHDADAAADDVSSVEAVLDSATAPATATATAVTATAAQVAPPARPSDIALLLRVIVIAIVVCALYVGQDVLIPVTLAIMLSFVLSPLVDLLQRLRLWRVPAVGVSMLIALGVLGLFGTVIGSQAAALTADAPLYARTIEEKIEGVQALATARLAALTLALRGPDIRRTTAPAAGAPAAGVPATTTPGGRQSGKPGASTARTAPTDPLARDSADGSPRPLLVEIAPSQTSALVVARTIVEPILAPLETTVLVVIVAIFILLQREDLRDRFIRLAGAHDLHRTTAAMDDAGQRLSRYFVSQLGVNATFGLVIGFGVYAIGLPSPVLWGVMAGLLRFVPYIGAMLAAVPPLALSAAIDPGWSLTLYTALLFVLIEPLVGYVVEPLLYGHSTGLSPIAVIIAAVFWTWMWGPIGLILSTPLTLCLVVMGRHTESLRFLDVLLGDRPALSESARLYQRALADDPDEALDQAEKLLADRSLLDYYDGVVMPALRLAARDHARGVLTNARSLEMARSMLTIVRELEPAPAAAAPRNSRLVKRSKRGDVDERPAAPVCAASVDRRIACVAGRGPFDEAVSAMLAQLLAQSGMPACVVTHTAVSRERIGQLDLQSVTVLALSYLELEGSAAHIRYLTRRLHHHAPGAPVIVGVWRDQDSGTIDSGERDGLGAEAYVASLREAIEAARAAWSRERAPRLGDPEM
jgi:predicted PurR-regulated permease PerM